MSHLTKQHSTAYANHGPAMQQPHKHIIMNMKLLTSQNDIIIPGTVHIKYSSKGHLCHKYIHCHVAKPLTFKEIYTCTISK